MAETGTPVVGHNIDSVKKQVKTTYDKIKALKEERRSTNAPLSEARQSLKVLGINKKAFDVLCSYMEMEAEERRTFDISFALVREALGVPLQLDLFDDLGEALANDLAAKMEKRAAKDE